MRIQDDPEAMAALSLLQGKGYNGDEVREALLKLDADESGDGEDCGYGEDTD